MNINCAGVDRDSVEVAMNRYRAARKGVVDGGLASMTTYPGYVYERTYFTCEITHTWQYVPAMGEYVHLYYSAYCTFWNVYRPTEGEPTEGGGFAGGDSLPPDSMVTGEAECDQFYFNENGIASGDPKCLKKLTTADSALFRRIMDSSSTGRWRPLSQISDTSIRRQCREVFLAWDYAFSTPNAVWKGVYSDSTADGIPTHYGQTITGDRMHADSQYIAQAMTGKPFSERLLGSILSHEAIHYYYPSPYANGHPPGALPPYPNEDYFNVLELSKDGAANSCFK